MLQCLPIRMRMSTSNRKQYGSFLYKNTYPKGRALLQMYRVVTKIKQRISSVGLVVSVCELTHSSSYMCFRFGSSGSPRDVVQSE